MLSYFNRFIDWFLQREPSEDSLQLQSPSQLTHGLGEVTVVMADPVGSFASAEAKLALKTALIEPLNQYDGLIVRNYEKAVNRPTKPSLTDSFNQVVEEGREILKEEKADLLMWGEVDIEHQSVKWYFISAVQADPELGVPGMMENILIPFETEKPALDVLSCAILAATIGEQASHKAKIGEYLLGAIEPLSKLPSGLTSRKTPLAAKISILGMAAVIQANMARRGESLGWFEPALEAFTKWEDIVERDKTPIEWALVSNHHAWLFEHMASHEDDKEAGEHIAKAIELFEEISTVFTPKDYPLEWASIQVRIGSMCAKVGKARHEPEYLQRAAKYFKTSLDIYNQTVYPLNWADVMSRMAKTLMLHGQLVKGAQSLEQAGVAFQAILKIYTDEKYPAQWASTQNNLGATLFALAKRDPSTPEWLNHALLCFQAARNYYRSINQHKMVHIIEKNMEKAQLLRDEIQEKLDNDLTR